MTQYNCYTDASTLKHLNYPTSGIAAVIVNLDYDRLEKSVAQHLETEDNIVAELKAISLGISVSASFLTTDDLLRVCSDCQPALDLITEQGESDLPKMSRILDKIDRTMGFFPCDIEFQWVKSHSNHPINDFADSLAHQHAQGQPYHD